MAVQAPSPIEAVLHLISSDCITLLNIIPVIPRFVWLVLPRSSFDFVGDLGFLVFEN